MFGMNGFHVSASGAIQGHHGPLVHLFSQPSQSALYDTHENTINPFQNKPLYLHVKVQVCEAVIFSCFQYPDFDND